jgi:GT2 family glycosyltransferase
MDEIRKDFAHSRLFVVKDPRITRLLPLWLPLLDQLEVEPVIVYPVRNPLEVASSLCKRNGFSSAHSLLMYVRSYLEAELASRERRRFFVRYDQLLSDWRILAGKLANVVGSFLPRPNAELEAEIDKFLTRDLYHNRSTREELAGNSRIAMTVVEMFDRMVQVADGGDEMILCESFDRLRETVGEATKLFQPLVASAQQSQHYEVARLRSDYEAAATRLQDDIAATRAHRQQLEQALEGQCAAAIRLESELTSVRDQAAALRHELDWWSRATARIESELKSARDQSLELCKELELRSATIVQLEIELGSSQRQAEELGRESEARLAAVARLENDLADALHQRDTQSMLAVRRDAELTKARQQIVESIDALQGRVNELSSIKASTCWRITEPLRWIGGQAPTLVRLLRRALKLAWWALTLQLRSRRRGIWQRRADAKLIASSSLFDSDWYLDQYPDLRPGAIDPVLHYLQHGGVERRNPSPHFDSGWYLSQYGDVAAAGINPLVHYLRHGALECRHPVPFFGWNQQLSKPRPDRTPPLLEFRAAAVKAPRDLECWCSYFGEATAGEIDALQLECATRGVEPLSLIFVTTGSPPSDSVEYDHWRATLTSEEAPHLVLLGESEPVVRAWQNLAGAGATVTNVTEVNEHIGSDDKLIVLVRARSIPMAKALKLAARAMALRPDAYSLYFDEVDHDVEGRLVVRAWPDYGFEAVRQFVIDPGLVVARFGSILARGGCRAPDLWRSFPRSLFDQTTIHLPVIGARVANIGADRPTPEALPVPTPVPSVSIIIPTKDAVGLLKACIESLLHRTIYSDLEILVLDNNSKMQETRDFFNFMSRDRRVRIVPHDKPFNFAELCNRGVEEARGEYICLMNNDVEAIEPNWLTAMIRHAAQPDVGAVGALLMNPHGGVQHCGVVLGLGGTLGDNGVAAHSPTQGEIPLRVSRAHERSAVTAACLVMKKERYHQVGGMNEEKLPIAFNDVDLCLKLQQIGYRNVMEPAARLLHHESASMKDHHSGRAEAFCRECAYMRETWRWMLDDDPHYNPNLSLLLEHAGEVEWSRRCIDRVSRRLGIAALKPPDFRALHPFLLPYATASNPDRARLAAIEERTVSLQTVKAQKGLLIVVPTLDHPEYVIPLCNNLMNAGPIFHSRGLGFEVILADTGSTNAEVLAFYRTLPIFFHVKYGCKYHFSRLNNQMVEEAPHTLDTLLFLNNDILFEAPYDSLRALYDTLHCEPSRGVVGAVLSFPDGSLQHGGIDVFRDGPLKGFVYHPNAGERVAMPAGGVRRCPAVTGALLMTKADAFRRAGGFDPGYAKECQDAALCLAIERLGEETVVLNAGRILHYENGTRRKGEECWPDRQRFMRQWNAWIASTIP